MSTDNLAPPGPTVPPDINLYNATNPGPYIVFVQPLVTEETKTTTKLHPITFGKFISSHKLKGIKSITRKGQNRLGITFYSYDNANQFVQNQAIRTSFNVFIPQHLTSVQGVIRQVDLSISIEELLANIQSSCKVISARRLNRRVVNNEDNSTSYLPTQTVVLTFSGCFLPKSVYLFYVAMDVQVYVLPVLRCYNCLRFGHTAKLCKSKIRCPLCTEEHTKGECTSTKPICVHCKGHHSALDPNCPELKRQQRIKHIMATERLSFAEAASLIPKLAAPNNSSNNSDPKSTDINNLRTPQIFPALTPTLSDINVSNNIASTSSSYSRVISANKKRKQNIPSQSVGYDKVAHNNLLNFPNGQLPKSLPRADTSLKNINQNDLSTLQNLVANYPNSETILNLMYSILLQAISKTSYNNHGQDTSMELSEH